MGTIATVLFSVFNFVLLLVLIFKKSDSGKLVSVIEEKMEKIQQKFDNLQDATIQQAESLKQEIITSQFQQSMNAEKIISLLNYNDPNLSPENSHWILEAEKFKKIYEPGRIEKVISDNGETELQYSYKDESIICEKYINGQLVAKTTFNQYAVPINGCLYDENSEITNEFQYDSLGQLNK